MPLASRYNTTMPSLAPELADPPRYVPFITGRYQVTPGLQPLGMDSGNGPTDGRIFQIDRTWQHYTAEKHRSRGERIDKYVCERELSKPAHAGFVELMLKRLPLEHPALFTSKRNAGGDALLDCRLSGETLHFDRERRLVRTLRKKTSQTERREYISAIDALCCQIQEDIGITELFAPRGDRLTALHVCLPNHWAPEEKVGRGFSQIHAPVAGFEQISRGAARMLSALGNRGPYVRFAWGIASDTRLNQHPEPSPDIAISEQASGRAFAADGGRYWVRIERQVTVPLPAAQAFLFTIRTYFLSFEALSNHERRRLSSALRSMSREAQRYKGLDGHIEALVASLAPNSGHAATGTV